MSKYNFYQRSCLWIMLFIFLTPTIRIGSMTGFRFEEIFILLILIFVMFYFNKGTFWKIAIPLRVMYFFCFSALMIISMAIGSFLILPASLLDLSKFIWLLKSIVIYLVFYNFIYCYPKGVSVRREYVLKYFVRFGFISSLICFQQYFDLFNLNSLYVPLVAPTQAYTLLPGYPVPRVVGMLGNPNVQGFVLALSLLCYSFLYLNNSKSVKFYTFICLFIALLMTLSRTSMIVFFAGTLILIMLFKKDMKFVVYKFTLLITTCLLLIGLYLVFKDNELVYKLIIFRFERLENGINDPSFVARMHQWELNIEYFKMSPIFGVGPLPRANIFGAADNEWLLFLRTYGIVGCTWLVLFFFQSLFSSKAESLESKNYKVFILSILCAACLYMIPAAIITSTVLFPFLIILLATHDRTVFILDGSGNKVN